MLKWILDNSTALKTIGELLAYIGAAGAFLIGAYKKLYKPLSEFSTRVMKALAELEPNGGGSMKDMAKSNQMALAKISKDITTMKATQEAEFQLNSDCKFECAPDGRCVKVNDALCRLFGATDRQQMYGYGWINFIDESEREHARQVYEDGVETDNVISSSYTINNGVTNEKCKCTYTAYVKRNPETNEIISIFGIVNKKS